MFDLDLLQKETRDACVFCNHPATQAAHTLTVVSGDKELVGKNKKKEAQYVCTPRMIHTAPLCAACEVEKLEKIKKMRPVNGLVGFLCSILTIGMMVPGGFLVSVMGFIPVFVGVLLLFGGIFPLIFAIRGFQRCFGAPEKNLLTDADIALKKTIMAELSATVAGDETQQFFTCRETELGNIENQNHAAKTSVV